MSAGKLIGVGLGPGDPELLTVKAVKAIKSASVVAFFAKAGRRGNAREIADCWIAHEQTEVPLYYPMTTETRFDHPVYIETLRAFYEASCATLAAHLEAGRDVALLAEGDPFFYGSFMHIYARLRERFETVIVPGVPGMAGCWSAAETPMTWGDDVLIVLPATLSEDEMVERLRQCDAAVIMKLGANLPKARNAVLRAGRAPGALYVERGTMSGEKVLKLADKADDLAPYFSLILIPGQGRRP
jgi:precorrin-2/cobalt-factor-2 C20-methyltransferase